MSTGGVYYSGNEVFPGIVGRTVKESVPAWPLSPRPASNSPNIVVMILDDVGFAELGCFGGVGGRIRTPYIDALAGKGLRYNNFHVTPMCSPTRAAILTGRNSHSVGVGSIIEMSTGFPGYNGRILKDTAMLPAILKTAGYTTAAVGKWHLTPREEITPIGPFDRWPVGQGFERFYGFMGSMMDHWNPTLWQDNQCVGQIGANRPEYHLTVDLVDRAESWIVEGQAVAPERPFFLYLAFGAMHQPHHVGDEWISPYEGLFSDGWDVIREEAFQHQKRLGIVPSEARLPPRNPGVESWDSLNGRARRLLQREMEVYAAFLTHTDAQIGRLIGALSTLGKLDSTIIILLSDNGANGGGGPFGRFTANRKFNNLEDSLESNLSHIAEWGGRTSFPNYARGWAMAGNTPNRWYKEFTHEGGIRAPLIVHWPSTVRHGGAVRAQFHAANDIVPTVLEAIGCNMPEYVDGERQRPLEGTSLAYTFQHGDSPTRKERQYFEMYGHRAMWADGWKAVTAQWTNKAQETFIGRVEAERPDGRIEDDTWELYHLDSDYSESHDLAGERPERLRALINEWWSEAARYQVLPVDDRMGSRTSGDNTESGYFERRSKYEYAGRVQLTAASSPNVRNRAHVIRARFVTGGPNDSGAIVADGGPEGGYCLCLMDGLVHYVVNRLGKVKTLSAGPVFSGAHEVEVTAERVGDHLIRVTMSLDGAEPGPGMTAETNPVRYDSRGTGLRIGADTRPVWDRYEAPFSLSCELMKVVIWVDGDEVPDRDAEVEAALYEQ